MICLITYGTESKDDGAVEAAVRLPCGHDVGAECIRTWLSPDKEAKNSCPACRMSFFPAQPQLYREHGLHEDISDEIDDDDENEDGDDWHRVTRNANPIFLRNILRVIAEDGQPRQERPQRDEEEEQELQEAQDYIRRSWPQFLGTTTEQYEESTQRARALVAESRVLNGEEGLEVWLPRPDSSDPWDPVRPENFNPRELEDIIQHLATAYRTLPFREALSYSIMRDLEPSYRFPHPSQLGGVQRLNAEQEEIFFREMEIRGAFEMTDFRHQHGRLTNLQRWISHRHCGEVWHPVEWVWSADWISQLNEDDENVPPLSPES